MAKDEIEQGLSEIGDAIIGVSDGIYHVEYVNGFGRKVHKFLNKSQAEERIQVMSKNDRIRGGGI